METFTLINGKPTITKDPAGVLDYVVDWTDWLAVVGDTIASAQAVGTGVTVDSTSVVDGNKKVLVWVSGGVANTPGQVVVRITTASNPARVDERSLYFRLKQR